MNIGATEGPASWVDSLRVSLRDCGDLELVIASPCPARIQPFTEDGTIYYGMAAPEARTRVGRAVANWRSSFSLADMNDQCDEVLRHVKPDIVHVHGTENPFGLIGLRNRVPLVISLQGLLTACERFFFQGLTSREVASLMLHKRFALGWGEIQSYWRVVRMAERERRILRGNRSFIGRTDWDRSVLWAVNAEATYYHCDEVLRPTFYRTPWRPQPSSPRTIFCTSSTLFWKGAECLIEALAILREAGYEDVRLRIAGIPPQPSSEFYAARARKHGVMPFIDWLGRLDAQQLAEELLGAAVFAYPSHIDNSPNALCEALLVGVPTVATYVGGVPSLLVDGHEGRLCPDGDPYALAGRIRGLLDDTRAAAEMGRRARERALRRHDPESIVATLMSIYGEVLS